jgi:twinkle protein
MLSDQAEGIQKFDLQDKVMSRLRKIATNYNVHMVIVIHPRKTEDTEDIQIHSIYGTSKAAQ